MTPGFHWTLRPSVREDDPVLKAFPAELPLLVKQLLLQRGFTGGAETDLFLEPRLSHLSDPFLMGEMRAAVDRIFQAVDEGETVCIYGDYDVDGVTSVALLRAILMSYDLDPQYFIPVRSREGYGLSEAGIERCLCECAEKPSLLITVDCGTSSVKEVDMLNGLGIDVIILDHHEAGPLGRPDAVAVVNAKIEEDSPYTYLCSAGVVFKLAHALLKERKLKTFDLKLYLDLVAVATVADIVPLVDENRILVRHGLGRLAHSRHTGLKTLTEIAGIRPSDSANHAGFLNAAHVGFRIGPRINAAGRMDSPMDALELLLTMDNRRAVQLAQMLDSHNRKRQEEEEAIRTDAVEMLHNSFDPERDNVIVLGSRAWHPGVVGIVASQLMRRYHKPTFVIAFDESGVGKGSGRSIPGVSLVQAIHHCADTLVSGGGHDMAAGLVIEESRMDDFRKAFNRYVSETTTEEQRSPVLNIDMEVSFQALTLDLLDSYEKLEPFGNSNPQPLFMSSDVFPTEPPKRVGTNHLKLFMRQGMVERDAIFFNGAERELPNPPWDIAFTIDRNVYRGRASLSISIQEIRSHREM
ncbi:single-stranded-DNA-specific exonuclease RecJ [Akkermansia sp.]|uniref:single-stranded-DNA-specific exonuclease RecJ n=1 Tax=Akkermansia sp. TaxID=1872421 RepID=UPI001BFF066B|nr:single-stranded-DNA-specific exonuclease RecJ [Akkermansia sp.]MBT8778134.1 single-stranded-DNA-specific exonuclease RecJ [Akkermansia muciniphila]